MLRKLLTILLLLFLCLGCTTALADGFYQVGDTVYDFSVTLSDGTETSLSELLQTHEAVMINFWATWCPPCRAELPYMEEALQQYQDRVAVIALSIEETDTAEVIEDFKQQNNLTLLPMGQDTNQLNASFYFEGIPTSFMVDRGGRITWLHTGAITATDAFITVFEEALASESAPYLTGDALLPEVTFSFRIVDAEGAIIPDVLLQICNDELCEVNTADPDGIISFTKPMGLYTLHILSAPEQYSFDPSASINLPACGGSYRITLHTK